MLGTPVLMTHTLLLRPTRLNYSCSRMDLDASVLLWYQVLQAEGRAFPLGTTRPPPTALPTLCSRPELDEHPSNSDHWVRVSFLIEFRTWAVEYTFL